MQEQEQTLLSPQLSQKEVERLTRWFKYQGIADELFAEREAQVAQWGDEMPPLGTGEHYRHLANFYRSQCQARHAEGKVTMADVLLEEVYEALAEADPAKCRDELIQVAAVAIKMMQGIDHNNEYVARLQENLRDAASGRDQFTGGGAGA